MRDVAQVAPASAPVPVTAAEERSALLRLGIGDLRAIAEKIGATNARSKEDLAGNIMARADEQGIGYTGYIAALDYAPANPVDRLIDSNGDGPEDEPEKAEQLSDAPLFDPYATTLKHFMFTIGDIAEPDLMSGLYDVGSVDEAIGQYFKNGYQPREVFVGGFDTRGHRVGWVLQKSQEATRYNESHLIMQTLTANPEPNRGTVTGFQADAYISNYLDDGWELIGVRFNGLDMASGGVYMVWFLAR